MAADSVKRDALRALAFAALSLFVLPLGAFLFTEYAQSTRDSQYASALLESVERDAGLPESEKRASREFIAAHPASSSCDAADPRLAQFREMVCGRYSELWQYHVADRVAMWALIGGVFVLLAIFGAGALAFLNRQAQYVSFVVGWNLLRFTSALQVVTQGALLLWLSFWLTAFFFEVYFIKIIGIAAVLVGLAVLHAIVGIFRRPPAAAPIAGRLVSEADAPQLWAHLRRCADLLGTSAPDHLVAGIDANFFVTEAPLTVGETTLRGRSLYVSLPLLRVLDRSEADAVLVHELAHLRGGDTASSAKLGPKLVDFDHYGALMRHGGATIIVFHVMFLYRLIFELALRRDGRHREFLADRTAAQATSARAIAQSLIKLAAYSSYRSEVERQLFAQDARHDEQLGIAARIAAGLAGYAASSHFVDSMKTANVPHPYDSHPPLPERMRNVGHEVAEPELGAIVTLQPAACWADDIQTAGEIESQLWDAYEREFADAHEASLAYRYLPANDAERAIVLRHFPDVSFALDDGARVEISYAGLRLPGSDELMSWDGIGGFEYESGLGSDVLKITLSVSRSKKVKLEGIGDRRDAFKQALGNYFHRHRVMRTAIPA